VAAVGTVVDVWHHRGNRSATFNISTTAALVGCSRTKGAKHGTAPPRRAVARRRAGGLASGLSLRRWVRRCLEETGTLHVRPVFHPAMKHDGPTAA
jgi:anthranilate phosphoribosyltransferase